MRRLKICQNRLEAENIIHALNKHKIVALMKAYSGVESEHKDKLEILVNPDNFDRAIKIIEDLEP